MKYTESFGYVLPLLFTSIMSTGCVDEVKQEGEFITEYESALNTAPILVGAGDIAVCGSSKDDATSALLDGIFASNPNGSIFTAGDNSNDSGTAAQYTNCFAPNWGRRKSLIRPTPGNHDYMTRGASAYYSYFGLQAGLSGKGYYSYELGAWHIVVLNSNCSAVGGCGAGSSQEQWLRTDLAAHPAQCTLAYWHHPRFSSGAHGSSTATQALWQALDDYDAEVVISGHDHDYERFAPQTPTGAADASTGIRQFVVGTGGASLRPFGTIRSNSQVRNADANGVLMLTLRDASYDWQFIPIAGRTFTDSGTTTCH